VHTLVGDLIREGATGVAGHVAEPYLQSTVRPQILFPAYLAGFNLIEAFYLAIPHLSWQTVVIGDPLCAPFPRPALTRADLEDPVDPQTEMPGLFGKRRLEAAQRAGKDIATAAVQFLLLAETRNARGDPAGTRQALEQATALAPTLAGAQLQLALLYDQAKEYERAAERYRVLLEAYPDNAVVLNNLAYVLAERLNAPAEAKPLAERASALAPDDPNVIDTRAWIEHLLGNHGDAAKLIAKAAAAAPGNAELRLHAAFIYAAMKNGPAAAEELEAALKIDPDLARRDDVRELRTRIGGKGV
jgi:Tfp pilus assembly protein PilF